MLLSLLLAVALASAEASGALGSLLYLVPARSNPPYHRASMVSAVTDNTTAEFSLLTADPPGFVLRNTLSRPVAVGQMPSLGLSYQPTSEATIKKWKNISFEAFAFFEEVSVVTSLNRTLHRTNLADILFKAPSPVRVVAPPDTRTYAASLASEDSTVAFEMLGSETSLRTRGRAYVSPLSTMMWMNVYTNVTSLTLEKREYMFDRLSVLLCAESVVEHLQEGKVDHFVGLRQKVRKHTDYSGFFGWTGMGISPNGPTEFEGFAGPVPGNLVCKRVYVEKERSPMSSTVTWSIQMGIGAVPPTLEVLWWTLVLYAFALLCLFGTVVVVVAYSQRVQDTADIEEELFSEGDSMMGEINRDSICAGQVQNRGQASGISADARHGMADHLRRRGRTNEDQDN